jgi:putative ABC transport system permease protein
MLMFQDLRFGARMLARMPGFTVVAVLTLALGVGANVAIFSVLDAVLLRPLPYGEAERLVFVWEHNLPRNRPTNVVSPANFLDWQDRARSFDAMCLLAPTSRTLLEADQPEHVEGFAVSPNFFEMLGVLPALGRTFRPDDAREGADEVLVISYGLWQRRFGGEPAIVGRSVRIGEAAGSATVIGVLPRNFQSLRDEEFWRPYIVTPAARTRVGRSALVVSRLAPDASLDEARAEMSGIAKALEREHSPFNAGWTVNVVRLREQLVGDTRPMLLMLFGAVALVLLIASANVGGLLVGRTIVRQRELSVRLALGATRSRIVRQCLTESLLLTTVGALVGLGAAWWALDLILAFWPDQAPGLDRVAIDGRVLAFAVGVSAVTAVGFGLGPALMSASAERWLSLGRADARRTDAPGAARLRSVLVVGQVALSMTLLIAAGLMIQSVRHLGRVDPGFEASGVLTARIDLPSARYPEGYQQVAFFEALVERVRRLPSVTGAGVVSFLPFTGLATATSFTIVGAAPLPAGQNPVADIRMIDLHYFETMRIPLLEGRGFTEHDSADSPLAIVINRTMARQFWPVGEALGRRVRVNWSEGGEAEVIGVVGDVQHVGLDAAIRPMVYYSQRQEPFDLMTLTARTSGDPAALAGAIRGVARELDPSIAVQSVRPLDAIVRQSIASRRFTMVLLTAFSSLALVLTGVGLYGVLSSLVSQRLREIGVRVALGASRADILRLVAGRALLLGLAGVALGAGGALLVTRFMASLLFGVAATDPVTFFTLPFFLVAVAALAAWVPARRATTVDPAVVLKWE